MSVVKINAITVPEGMSEEFMERFAKRAGSVEQQPGFEEFLLLRPTDDNPRFFVFTRWASEADFQNWISGSDFAAAHAHVAEEAAEVVEHGHGNFDGDSEAEAPAHGGGHPGGHPGGAHGHGGEHGGGHGHGGGPVGVSAELLAFDVVERVTGSA
ncbi:MAG: antibiotic biosynthesis monooxygenase [Actinomycetota bacterium]